MVNGKWWIVNHDVYFLSGKGVLLDRSLKAEIGGGHRL